LPDKPSILSSFFMPTSAEARRVFSPRRERLRKRNRVVAARYYYWTELHRRREDDVRRLLCDNEFFVEERTVANALADQNAYLGELIRSRASRGELRRLYPGFDWR
jgi:hypothetical protein